MPLQYPPDIIDVYDGEDWQQPGWDLRCSTPGRLVGANFEFAWAHRDYTGLGSGISAVTFPRAGGLFTWPTRTMLLDSDTEIGPASPVYHYSMPMGIVSAINDTTRVLVLNYETAITGPGNQSQSYVKVGSGLVRGIRDIAGVSASVNHAFVVGAYAISASEVYVFYTDLRNSGGQDYIVLKVAKYNGSTWGSLTELTPPAYFVGAATGNDGLSGVRKTAAIDFPYTNTYYATAIHICRALPGTDDRRVFLAFEVEGGGSRAGFNILPVDLSTLTIGTPIVIAGMQGFQRQRFYHSTQFVRGWRDRGYDLGAGWRAAFPTAHKIPFISYTAGTWNAPSLLHTADVQSVDTVPSPDGPVRPHPYGYSLEYDAATQEAYCILYAAYTHSRGLGAYDPRSWIVAGWYSFADPAAPFLGYGRLFGIGSQMYEGSPIRHYSGGICYDADSKGNTAAIGMTGHRPLVGPFSLSLDTNQMNLVDWWTYRPFTYFTEPVSTIVPPVALTVALGYEHRLSFTIAGDALVTPVLETETPPRPATLYYLVDGNAAYNNGEVTITPSVVVDIEEDVVQADMVTITPSVTLTVYANPDFSIRDFTQQTVVFGAEYQEAVLARINAQRAAIALPPFVAPTRDFYLVREDVASIHSRNMAALQIFAHESPTFPEGYRSIANRIAKAEAENGGENVQLQPTSPYYDAAGNAIYSPAGRRIINEYTMPSPDFVFHVWWDSIPHRLNMMSADYPEGTVMLLGMDVGEFGGTGEPTDHLWFYFTNNFLMYPNGDALAVSERYLQSNVAVTGALIEWLHQTVNADAYTDVKTAHRGVYSLRFTAKHVGLTGCRVAAAHTGLVTYTIHGRHTGQYGSTVSVRRAHRGVYALAQVPVAADHVGVYGGLTARAHNSSYGPMATVRKAHGAQYTTLPVVRRAYIATYGAPPMVRNAHRSPYSTYAQIRRAHQDLYVGLVLVRQSNRAPYTGLTPVRTPWQGVYALATADFVRRSHRSTYSSPATFGQVLSYTPQLLHKGVAVPVADGYLEGDEGTPYLSGRFRLGSSEVYNAIQLADAIDFIVAGVTYSLVVIGKSRDRDAPAGRDLVITAASPLVLLDGPYVSPKDYVYTTALSAESIVEDILQQPVDWQLPVWVVPAYRAQFYNTTALDAARTLVAAAGGILQSRPDGVVVARLRYPYPVHLYDAQVPSHLLAEGTDVFSGKEQNETREGHNRFRIREGSPGFADALEWIPDEVVKTKGVLRAYPSPWRTHFQVRATIDNAVPLIGAPQVRQETEVVEFVNGKASLRYPAKLLESMTWLSTPLGGVALVPYSREITTETAVNNGYGLAEVVYQVEAYQYELYGNLGDQIQYVMEDLPS